MPSRFTTRSFLILFLSCAPLIVGCQGCREDQQASTAPPSAPLIARELESIPSDKQTSRMLVKPGHWMSVSQSWQSNADDLRGTLTFRPKVSGSDVSALDSVRPAVLPKGQSKQLDCRILVPRGLPGEKKAIDIQTNFEAGTQAIPKDGGDRLAEAMGPHEYFFTILSKRSEQLTVLQVSDWVRPPQTSFSNEQIIDYRVVAPSGDSRIPLPETVFEWTSTAYVFWDDVTPEQLTIDQRRALRDWVYWGGQLLINGPACAETLVSSDLADLLPLETVRGVGVEADELIELVNQWSVKSDTGASTVTALLRDNSERIGVAGNLKVDSSPVPGTSDLVIERAVGKGRVVMTRFDLSAGWLLKWDSLQSFYNGVLLRRPPRIYKASNGEAIMVNAGDFQGREHDARFNSRVHFIARDLSFGLSSSPFSFASQSDSEVDKTSSGQASSRQPSVDDAGVTSQAGSWLPPNDFYKPDQGVAAWTDSSDATLAAIELLREEAGITIPSVRFVAKSLAVYLLILVPVNYLLFWLIGRLEWAWVMVPIIGLAGAAWIARSAQLDIGFARSRTEIDILELHAGYQRGHVTRYMAVYNSLSTMYSLNFDSQDAVAAPFGVFADAGQYMDCRFRQAFEPNVSLTGFAIPSNQTGTIHAEQMVDVGGPFSIKASGSVWEQEWELVNQSDLTMYDAVVVGRDMRGELFNCSLGIIEPATTNLVRMKSGEGKVATDLPLSIDRILTPLADGRSLKPGQVLLVGRVEEAILGAELMPAVSQATAQTVVAVHLVPGRTPAPLKDVNLRKDINVEDIDAEFDQRMEGN